MGKDYKMSLSHQLSVAQVGAEAMGHRGHVGLFKDWEERAKALEAEVDHQKATINGILNILRPLGRGPEVYWEAWCPACGWFGFSCNCVLESPNHDDSNVLCPLCGACVEDMCGTVQGRIKATYERVLAIVERDT